MTAKIIQLDSATIEDAAKVLRAIADEIDAGEHGKVSAAIVICLLYTSPSPRDTSSDRVCRLLL